MLYYNKGGDLMIEKFSKLTCPHCNYEELLEMPGDSCIYYHTCNSCNEIIKPKLGDCCVFCSYGSVPCPPIQAKNNK